VLLWTSKNGACATLPSFMLYINLKIDGKIKNTFLMYLVDVEMLAEVKMPSAFLRILIFIIT
jgi:hypothetical protein